MCVHRCSELLRKKLLHLCIASSLCVVPHAEYAYVKLLLSNEGVEVRCSDLSEQGQPQQQPESYGHEHSGSRGHGERRGEGRDERKGDRREGREKEDGSRSRKRDEEEREGRDRDRDRDKGRDRGREKETERGGEPDRKRRHLEGDAKERGSVRMQGRGREEESSSEEESSEETEAPVQRRSWLAPYIKVCCVFVCLFVVWDWQSPCVLTCVCLTPAL